MHELDMTLITANGIDYKADSRNSSIFFVGAVILDSRTIQYRLTNVKLNLLKGFACFSVVFIHITFPGLFGQVVFYASAYAVPIFFMISGYYAFGQDEAVLKRRLKKIIKIFLYAYALFFLFSLAVSLKNHELMLWLNQNFNWKTPIKYICFCTIDFAIPLWYLIALIEVYVFWIFVVKRNQEAAYVRFLPVLFAVQIIWTSYCETMELDWFWKINFITRALPWFLLGYYLNMDQSRKLRDIDSYKLVLISIAGCIIAVIPLVFRLQVKFNSAGYIPYAFGLFSLCLKNSDKSIFKPMEFIGDKLSLYIYIYHVLIAILIGFVAKFCGLNRESLIYLWSRPIVVLFTTLMVSLTCYMGSHIYNM